MYLSADHHRRQAERDRAAVRAAVTDPCRGPAAIITVADPFTIESVGPTHVHRSPTPAAGRRTSTLGVHGPRSGRRRVAPAARRRVTIGHACMSVNRAAGGIRGRSPSVDHHQGALDDRLSGRRQFGRHGALPGESTFASLVMFSAETATSAPELLTVIFCTASIVIVPAAAIVMSLGCPSGCRKGSA